MCRECGCGVGPQNETYDHDHDHGHSHDDVHPGGGTRTIEMRRRVLAHNDDLAERLRSEFSRRGVLAVNLMSGPGSGKTELLATTMSALRDEWAVAAVTGDLATENDATRLAATGCPSRQILTGTMCHLEADMLDDAIRDWDLNELDLLFIENVGNLVCPSDFDLGEQLRVMLVSTTEGEDKPLKYPTLTRSADVAVVSKVDLADAVGCDIDLLEKNLREVKPDIEIVRTSARTGEGLDAWVDLLIAEHRARLPLHE